MKFVAFLLKNRNSNDHVRLTHQIAKGNHTFPNRSSKAGLIKWCEKNIIDDSVVESINIAWQIFEDRYPVTLKQEKKYID